MQHFITFLVDNWKIILEIFVLILSVVVFIIRKPTNKVVSGLYENLFLWCVEGIRRAEILVNSSGSDKLIYATDYVVSCIKRNFPMCNSDEYLSLIRLMIEGILDTPTKKGGLGREKETLKKG